MKHLFLLATVAMISVKMSYTFSWQQLSGKHIPSRKSCNLLVLVQTIIEKMDSNKQRLLKKICHKVVSCVNC